MRVWISVRQLFEVWSNIFTWSTPNKIRYLTSILLHKLRFFQTFENWSSLANKLEITYQAALKSTTISLVPPWLSFSVKSASLATLWTGIFDKFFQNFESCTFTILLPNFVVFWPDEPKIQIRNIKRLNNKFTKFLISKKSLMNW